MDLWMGVSSTGGKLAPVQAEVHNQQRGKREGDDADSGEGVAEVAPVAGPEVEHAAGDEGECYGVGAGHPLAVLDYLPVARGEEGSRRADDPGGSLHGGSGQAWTTVGKGNPGGSADKDTDDIDTSENAMKLEVTLAKSRRELDGATQEGDRAAECMRDQKMPVRDDLQTVGVIHGIVGDEQNF
ncbi:MAG TPA: hypothetical protein VMD58_05750 [Acidobacteriaceae bacterium]|nr:hypothetical protein [Acidobacteriaceae bacterium]